MQEQVASPPVAVARLAFDTRWNGWAVFGIFIVVAVLVVLLQTTVAAIAALMHRDLISAFTSHHISKEEFTIRLLTPSVLFFTEIVSAIALVGAAFLLCRVAFGTSTAEFGLKRRLTGYQPWLAILAGALLLFAGGLLGAVQAKFFGHHPQAQELAILRHHGIGSFVIDFVAVSLLAPVVEEIFFRGFLFAALVQRMPMVWAAILSGVIFGAVHLDVWNVLPLATIGVGLAYLYYRARNLWANVIAHSTVNTISLVLAFTAPQLIK